MQKFKHNIKEIEESENTLQNQFIESLKQAFSLILDHETTIKNSDIKGKEKFMQNQIMVLDFTLLLLKTRIHSLSFYFKSELKKDNSKTKIIISIDKKFEHHEKIFNFGKILELALENIGDPIKTIKKLKEKFNNFNEELNITSK